MNTKPYMRLALAAILAAGVSGAAIAQQGTPTATESQSDSTTVQPDGTTTASPDAMAPAAGGAMAPAAPAAEGAMAPAGDAMAAGSGDMVEVGGAPMYANMTIAENAPNAPNLSTLVAAVSAAGLVETLGGEGPFTVFAPDNAAFEKLPAGTVDTLLEPANADQLTSILTYHVVPAEATAAAAMQMIEDDGGMHEVTTVQGDTLTLAMDGDNLTVTDEQGNVATVTQADVMQSNGVVHVIDTVLMPAS